MTTATHRAGATDHWFVTRRDADTGIESLHAHFNGHAYDGHDHDDTQTGYMEPGGRRGRADFPTP
ncbi:hypothetical protein [Burkholderia anthina]|uniref:hypothetical protein n=1 Tax=Burkholderia anthina TaxID=179879 RepID=UPI000F592256|nr:hypothetical protein [Burkholderia anthina]RQV85281.1 hypothetical protein DF160_06630 [Burkholderia anthina]